MSAWQELVTASLIGTERSGVPRAEIPGRPGVQSTSQDPAAVLLDQAALLTAARRAGRQPIRAEPLPAAAPDPRPAVSQPAARRLARMLGGEHRDLLAEWLAAAAARGLRVPAQLLPALLNRAGPAGPRHLVAEVGGSRARWLARLNPRWQFLLAETPGGDDAWRVGTGAERREYLAALRARDPGAARDLITGSWEMADAGERATFLTVLADGLGPADEPLLETALGDRADQVRGQAASLLARLPGSALGQRMAERALGCVRLHQGGTRLVIIPPVQCDSAMRRDGIPPRSGAGLLLLDDQTHLMLEVLARTPLRAWTGEFGRSAEQILALPSGGWAPVLFIGWSRAAMAQRDQEWMAVLLSRALAGDEPPGTPLGAETLRQLARRADPALVAPPAAARRGAGLPPSIHDALTVLRFRYNMLKELDDDHSAG